MRNNGTTQNVEAILWVTASVGLFSLVYASGKFAGDSASALQILLLRYVSGFATLICMTLFIKQQPPLSYRSNRVSMHVARAFMGSFGGVFTIYAATNMPIVDATAIGLLDTVFLVLLGVILLNEVITRKHWLAIIICVAGATTVMISKDAFHSLSLTYLVPAVAALLGALLIAIESIMIKKLTSFERPMTVLLHVNAFGILLLLIPAIFFWKSTAVIDNLPFLMLGPIAIAAQYLTLRGYKLADVSIVGPVNYTWIIFAALIGFLFFEEIPGYGTVLGSALIVSGGVILALLKNPKTV